jgi:hypothetical protein
MKYNKIICWVTKRHEKLMKKAFPEENMTFVNSVDEINQEENDVVVISVSKITNMKIAEKIRELKDPYFLEIKGIWTYNMIFAMERSKHSFMIGKSSMDYILKDIVER